MTKDLITVYNFQVEDFHTYYVGKNCVFVHNAECTIEFNNKSGLDEKEFKQQLADQQKGLNELTVDEYLNNRKQYQKMDVLQIVLNISAKQEKMLLLQRQMNL